jgi:hypothetical protein
LDDSRERIDILYRIIDQYGHDHGKRPVLTWSRQTLSDNPRVFDTASAINRLNSSLYSPVGEVAEWLKAPLSKSGVRQRTAGSNPALSATCPRSRQGACRSNGFRWIVGAHAERCESGLIGTPGKRVCRQRYRGFESRPLRHKHPVQPDTSGVFGISGSDVL